MLRPKATRAGNKRKQGTTGARKGTDKKKKRKRTKRRKMANETDRTGQILPGGSRAKQKAEAAKGKVRRTRTHLRGRPARPSQEERADTHTHGIRAWRPPTQKWTSWRPRKTAPVHPLSPLLIDGRYGKPNASLTGSTHANHCSGRRRRPTPEGPAMDNPIAGPRTGTKRSELSAPASAGASGRHNQPSSQPASACAAQLPSKARSASPRVRKRDQGVRKADWSTQSDHTGQGAAHHARPRGTPERYAAGHNKSTWTGAKQQWLPGAANPESAHNTQRSRARERVPSNTPRRPDGCVRARQQTQHLPATE